MIQLLLKIYVPQGKRCVSQRISNLYIEKSSSLTHGLCTFYYSGFSKTTDSPKLWTRKDSEIRSKGNSLKLVIQENVSYPIISFQNGRLCLPLTLRIVSCNWSQTRHAYLQVKLFLFISISKYSWGHESEHSLLEHLGGRHGTLRLQSYKYYSYKY